MSCLLTALGVYALLFVWNTSFFLDGKRYFLLFDDAKISMKYAETFARGGGLVWFSGAERVQGFSNPLWTLLMVLVHLLPLPPEKTSLPIQVLGAVSVVGTAYYAARIVALLSGGSVGGPSGAFLVGLYLPLHIWSALGMEAGFLTLLLTAATYFIVSGFLKNRVGYEAAFLLALGVLVRLDFALFAVVGVGFLWWHSVETRAKWRVRWLVLSLVPATVAIALISQYAYYGELLPNTASLKLGVPLPTRLARGFSVTGLFLWSLSIPIALMSAVVWARARTVPRPLKLLVTSFVSIALAYNVWVGGDAWEDMATANRFLLPVVPLILIVFAFAARQVLDLATARKLRRSLWWWSFALVCLWLRVNVGALTDPSTALSNLRQLLQIEEVLTRNNHDLGMLKAGVFVQETMRKPSKIAVSSAGIAPYLIKKGEFVDILGRCDRFVSRLPPREVPYLPGHVKWDLDYSIGQLRPDVAIGNWGGLSDHFQESVMRIPGEVPLFIRERSLATAFVPRVDLLMAFRRLSYGPDVELIAELLGFEGFYDVEDNFHVWMKLEGSMRLPPGASISFDYEAVAPLEVQFLIEGELYERQDLQPGSSKVFRYAADSETEVRIIASRTYRPMDLGLNEDPRELSIVLRRIDLR